MDTSTLGRQINAASIEKLGFTSIKVSMDEADHKIKQIGQGLLKPYLTRSNKINTLLGGFFEAEQVVLAARPGVGKSAMINWILEGMSDPVLNPDKLTIFLYWSVEMKAWRQVIRLYSLGTYKDFELGKMNPLSVKEILSHTDPIQKDILERLLHIRSLLEERPIFFREQTLSAKKFGEIVRKIQEVNPGFTIVNIWDHTRLVLKDNEKSEEEKITNLMSEGMTLKNEISCINFWLSQMNRNIESNAAGAEIGKRPPVASDIFGSDAVQQFADIVLAGHRPENYNIRTYMGQFPTQDLFALHVLKQREGWTGLIRIKHNLKYNTFQDWADDGAEDN